MLRNILTFIFVFGAILTAAPETINAQNPTPSPPPTAARANKKRITGVKIESTTPSNGISDGSKSAKTAVDDKEAKKRQDELDAKKRADQLDEQKRRDELAAKDQEVINARAEKERIERENADLQAKAEEAARIAKQNEEEKQKLLEQSELDAKKRREEEREKKLQDELEEKKRQDELAAKEQEIVDTRARNERISKENADLQLQAIESKKAAEAAEKAKLEAERVASEKAEKEKAALDAARSKMIEMTAKRLRFLNVADAVKFVPQDVYSVEGIEGALNKAIASNPKLVRETPFCDADFTGEPLNLELTSDDTLGSLLEDIRLNFGVNFLLDAEIIDLPIRVNVQNVPWNIVLCQQLSVLDIDARSVGSNVISLVRRSKFLSLQESRRKTAPLKTEYIKLKYLRPVIGGQSNLAGKTTGTASLESLEQAIQKILTSGGDNRSSISRIPGRAEFFIKATEEQLGEIKEVIAKADRPTYRVDIFGLVYTVNENKLRDIGSQLSVIANVGGRLSGVTTLPTGQQSSGGGGTTSTTGGTNNGGGGGLGNPFSQPGGLQAGSPNTILGARVRLGLVDFNYQLSLLEQLGVARRVEKPFVSAKDGTTATFENGTQIPVIIQSLNNFGSGGGGSIDFINAGTTLSATPQVIEEEDGVPKLVNLSLRLESNTPDLSIQTTGNVPSVNSRRIQNEITIAPNQAFIFGGSNDITDTNTVSRTPGVGGIPILGNLFKRKNKQLTDNKLYFAVWVQITLDDGSSPVETDTLNTTFPKPPSMDAPLKLPNKP